MSLELQTPPQCELSDVANQVVVTIAVKNGKLRHYPQRNHDVVAYFKEPGKASPEKPEQVRWVVRDLGPGQEIVIRAKDPGTGIFPLDEYRITAGSNSIVSGPPRVQPPQKREMAWSYSITLMEGKNVLDFIDPSVIIKNDP
jgi:hypothetical protein